MGHSRRRTGHFMHKGKTPSSRASRVMLRWPRLALKTLDSRSGGNTGCYYGDLLCLSGILKEDSKQITEFRLLVAEPIFFHNAPINASFSLREPRLQPERRCVPSVHAKKFPLVVVYGSLNP